MDQSNFFHHFVFKTSLFLLSFFFIVVSCEEKRQIGFYHDHYFDPDFFKTLKEHLHFECELFFSSTVENLFYKTRQDAFLVFFNFDLKGAKALIENKKPAIEILMEPKTVKKPFYHLSLLRCFRYVLTFDDDLVDNKSFHKFFYPVYFPNESFDYHQKTQLSCMLNANKFSKHEGELYSERRKIIDYFKDSKSFSLYGQSWSSKLACYKGIAKSKEDVLKKSLFTFCLENSKDQKGYITEKIFDCFRYGSIPIYFGPSNIDEYIPKGCYVDYSKFLSLDALFKFMQKFNDEDYALYMANILIFLESEKAKRFKPENLPIKVAELLNKMHLEARSLPIHELVE